MASVLQQYHQLANPMATQITGSCQRKQHSAEAKVKKKITEQNLFGDLGRGTRT